MLVRHAYAKINLALHVTGKREDGFHNLDSIVGFVHGPRTCDRIALARSDRYGLEIEGPFAPVLGDNTAANSITRTVDLLGRKIGERARNVAITLTKNLPVGAGLGGGSADAAAVLGGICDLLAVDLAPSRRRELALRVGSDVVVCLHGKACRMGGRGERIGALPPLPALAVLLVNPGVSVATMEVFAALKRPDNPPLPPLPDNLVRGDAFVSWLRGCGNDLLPAALGKAPVIASVLKAASALEGALFAGLSGSGATCFALFRNTGEAARAQAAINERHPRWWAHYGMLR